MIDRVRWIERMQRPADLALRGFFDAWRRYQCIKGGGFDVWGWWKVILLKMNEIPLEVSVREISSTKELQLEKRGKNKGARTVQAVHSTKPHARSAVTSAASTAARRCWNGDLVGPWSFPAMHPWINP